MNKDMDLLIGDFLNKWEAMLDASQQIPGFKWDFKVSITSSNNLADKRNEVIIGINNSFVNNGMTYTSTING